MFRGIATYDLPFGRGHKVDASNRVARALISDWTVSSVMLLQSGTPFTLTSGRQTVNNQSDGGVILNGITTKDLQNALKITQAPIGNGRSFWVLDPKFIGADTQANKQYFQNPTTPGVYASGPIILYGKNTFTLDATLSRDIRIREHLQLNLWAEALNVLNHPSFNPTGFGTINGNNFALMSGPSGNRTMQFRAYIRF